MELYFEQLTPLVILSKQAEETGKSVGQVEDETNKQLENPAIQEDPTDQQYQDGEFESTPNQSFSMLEVNNKEYEIYKK
jgi:hypothetical protein